MEPNFLENLDAAKISLFLEKSGLDCCRRLHHCNLTIFEVDELLITCPDIDSFKFLADNHKILCHAALDLAKRVTIVTEEHFRSFPVQHNVKISLASTMNQLQQQPITLSEKDVISEVLDYSGSAAIVRFRDDKGLFSNQQIELSSGARPNDWVGKTMRDYWPDDELVKFKRALLKDKALSSYEYVAYLFTGELARFNVEARLAFFRGDLVRIVKVRSCEPLF